MTVALGVNTAVLIPKEHLDTRIKRAETGVADKSENCGQEQQRRDRDAAHSLKREVEESLARNFESPCRTAEQEVDNAEYDLTAEHEVVAHAIQRDRNAKKPFAVILNKRLHAKKQEREQRDDFALSGTTHIFSTYLAAVSPDWKEQVGAGTLLKWPCGIAGQKNPGVCNGVRRIRGAIGYTEYTFAREAKLGIVKLRGASGAVVEPTSADWPILGKTYILVRKDTPPARRAALQAYFDWCLAKGGDTAKRLFYIPVAR